jgi:hypothetical protein
MTGCSCALVNDKVVLSNDIEVQGTLGAGSVYYVMAYGHEEGSGISFVNGSELLCSCLSLS